MPNARFQSDISGDPLIPADLFDSVIDNLLENLREKAQLTTDMEIVISLVTDGWNTSLTLCDNGSKVPDDKARHILHEPLKSDSGLGIGLYQAARQAEALGYTLALSSNQDGKVCFELSGGNT